MTPDVRAELVRLMRATIADRINWTYLAVRPLPKPPLPTPPTWKKGQHVIADCSKGVQWLCKWAGAPDPMANEWGTWGNSTTIAAVLQHVLTPAALRLGDIVTFGPDGTKHAAMVLETGIDPLLWSFGHQGAPNSYRLSEDRREHQFLHLPIPALTPDDEALRKLSGYWSWLAWSLGEAAWRNHPPFDRAVRPDVPRLIPPTWWRRRIRFLRARSKANPSTTRTPA